MQLKRSHPHIKALLAKTFPDYNGRKISLREATTYHMTDYWDGGTRSYVKAFNPSTGKAVSPHRSAQNPFNMQAHSEFEIPEGIVMVEHTIFCGHDLGIRIYVRPENMPKFLEDAKNGNS